MDYIYSIGLNTYLSCNEITSRDLCSSALSARNVLAFANDCCVYILPLEKPNELLPVNLNNSPCIYLAWSHDATHLLNICKNGVCNLYTVRANLLNTIDPVFSFRINRDEFISAKAFTKLPRVHVHQARSESVSYLEKFTYSHTPDASLPFNGFLVLNKTGKVGLFSDNLFSSKQIQLQLDPF